MSAATWYHYTIYILVHRFEVLVTFSLICATFLLRFECKFCQELQELQWKTFNQFCLDDSTKNVKTNWHRDRVSILKMKLWGPFVLTTSIIIQLVLSFSRPKNIPLSDKWLLREMNGAHLRLSATVVCCNTRLINSGWLFKLVN